MADPGETNGAGRGPVGHVLDLFVYAPLGFLAESPSIVPKLAACGRQQVESRVQLARMVGQFAVAQGRQQAAKVVNGWRTSTPPGDAPAPETVVPDDVDDADEDRVDAPPAAVVDAEGIAEEDLAIPSYDSLAASQVVPRLGGLSPVELEAVRRYELAHRGRRTVLGKIAILQQG